MNGKQRVEAVVRGEAVDRPPVWMMRQAGRTLPEYRALKEQHTFWELCHSPELGAEVSLQPLRRFPVDAAIIFSDILVIPVAMGIDVEFTPAPRMARTVRTMADVNGLVRPAVERDLAYVPAIIRNVVREVAGERAVFGFSGAPYTLACYMVDGVGSKGFLETRAALHHSRGMMNALLDRLTDAVGDYVEMQIEAGIDAFQLFDTWACDLTPELFREFVLPRVARLFERLQRLGVPGIYYINGMGALLEDAASTGAEILGIDWRTPMADVRQRLGAEQKVQGNLDPALLYGPVEAIEAGVREVLAATGGRNHIMNLGHGLSPSTPLAGIEAFVAAATKGGEA